MKLVSWNVNGLRACMTKGFIESMLDLDSDVICLQETKMQQGQAEIDLPGYSQYWNSADKKGYSGTAIFTKEVPLNVTYGIGIDEHDHEGRVITAEYPSFYLVNVYTPNSKQELLRLDYRMQWEDDFKNYLLKLDAIKPVIVCGDLNCAHTEIDLKNPKTNTQSAGFTQQERDKLSALLDAGFIDTWRYLHPDVTGVYSWWSYRFKSREKNAGWRIDYFLISERIKDHMVHAAIHNDIMGSDHCPVSLDIKL